MSKRKFVVWHNLKSDHGNCSWSLSEDQILTVRTHLGTKSTQLGSHPADLLARILTREINAAPAPGDLD